MSRNSDSRSNSGSKPRMSPVRRVWLEVVQPALVIGVIGAGAVLYLAGCARLSVIECDLARLDRACEQQEAVELELRRRLAQLQTPEAIQGHIAANDLGRPEGTLHVTLTDLPPALAAAFPFTEPGRERRQIGLGRLASAEHESTRGSTGMIASAHAPW